MKWRIAVIVLMLAGTGWGQTTRPATRPVVVVAAEDFTALKIEMERLIDEVAALRTENRAMRSYIERIEAAQTKAKPKIKADFKPGKYQITERSGTSIIWECDTLEDALRVAKNLRWELNPSYSPADGSPIYSDCIIRIGDKDKK